MSVIKDKYSDTKINLIYQMLLGEKEAGNLKEYDIRIDDLKVVSRTSDPERFFAHEDFIQENTRNVTVCLYDGASRRCTRYMLLLSEEDPQHQTLSGIERTISEKIVLERDKWEFEQLKTRYEEQTQQLRESEEYHGQLQERIRELEAEKASRPNKITDTIIGLAGMYLSKNPNALNGIPIIGGLLGGAEPSEKVASDTSTETSASEVEATFSAMKAEDEPVYTGTITEADTARFFKALIPLFPEQHREKVSVINRYLFHNHHLVNEIHDLLADAAKQMNDSKKAA